MAAMVCPFSGALSEGNYPREGQPICSSDLLTNATVSAGFERYSSIFLNFRLPGLPAFHMKLRDTLSQKQNEGIRPVKHGEAA
jgi:hypothetical protein